MEYPAMSTVTVEQLEALQQHAESIQNDATHDLRNRMEIGDAWAQGDVLIRRIEEAPEESYPSIAQPQLVPGNTQGAQHCLSDVTGIGMFHLRHATPLQGPIFSVAREVTVEHPEHGHVILGPGIYAIEYQRAYSDELRRIQD